MGATNTFVHVFIRRVRNIFCLKIFDLFILIARDLTDLYLISTVRMTDCKITFENNVSPGIKERDFAK